MGISSALPTSRRGYLSQSELAQYANITITNATEADDVISQAEEMIDAYVGFQDSFLAEPIDGQATAGASTTLTLDTDHLNIYDNNYFKGCEIEIIGGTGEGQRRRISQSTLAGVVTVADAWTTTPDTTSYYRIYQLGKFPRVKDVTSNTVGSTITYYKSIPEAIKRAVATQVQYLIEMGADFFTTDKADRQSESIGDYSYNLGGGSTNTTGVARLIGTKVKLLLRGYINRRGEVI